MGPRIPPITHDAAVRTGAEHAATAITTTASPRMLPRRRSPLGPAASRRGMASPAVAAASSRPTATTVSATPGQAGTVAPLPGGVTAARLTAMAISRPNSATPQPAVTSTRRLPSSSAASAATASPAVTQYGGMPGPPGLSSISDRAGRSGLARPGAWTPASSSSSDGWVATWIVHGTSSKGGTSTAIARFSAMPRRAALKASAATHAAMTAISHTSGTNAVATATLRPVAQAARRASRGGWVNIRAAVSAISGSSTKTTAVPILPSATDPMATGSSAYAAVVQTRTGAKRVIRPAAKYAVRPASGTQPSKITSTASHGLPAMIVASVAITARYGGALVAEPIPVGWKPCRYKCQSPAAPPDAGTSAPPPSVPGPSSERSATSAITVSPTKSSTPG